MDDVMGRIQEMLSDEESMQQIKELADMLSASSAPPEQPSPDSRNNNNSNNNNNNNNDIGFDFGMIFKIQEIMSAAKSDKDAELIMALKPHLSAEKQERADKAVKFMKLFSVWETLKSSGMLNDLNKFL
ncbi:MAG TPA: hypothetical protein DIW26_05975 [Ruminococcus sp.]|nr:hypothetical protein [Ruminococcus sp.]